MQMRRRALGVACVLALTACGTATGTADDAAGAQGDSAQARRAAAQLEVEALPGTGGGPFEGRELEPPLVTPRFALTDTAGQPFDFARDATSPVTMLYFGYTSCPDVCPAHMAALSKALSELPAEQADQVQVVFITVDTLNDDGARLRDYLDNFDPSFVGLTGTADEVNAALRSVGLAPTAISTKDEFPPQHPSDVLAYTGDRRAHVSYPFGSPPSAFAHDIPRLIDRSSSDGGSTAARFAEPGTAEQVA
jgi:protein SCO1/2